MTATSPGPGSRRSIDAWLDHHREGLIALRRNIHAHPELSGEEYGTTELVAERLELAGLHPRRLRSGTGLICDLAGDHLDRPIFALRADLDALGMDDEKDVPYRSQVPGVSHACGHDVHTVVMLGVALYFAHHLDELPGRLRMIFQPAEERVPGGALDVVDDGGLDGVDSIIGVHCDPRLDAGRIGLRAGPITSAADMAEITLGGPGGHTARPEETVDMVSLAARLVADVPRAVGEAVGDPAHVKFVVGSIHAGDAANVIPSNCEMRASVRTPEVGVWEMLPAAVEKVLTEALDGTGANWELEYTQGVPPVVNDHGVTEMIRRAAIRELGADAVTPAIQSWGGDDFAWYTRQLPGSYIRLGVHDPDRDAPRLDLHAGRFDVDERAIAIGVRLIVAAVHEFFATGRRG